jgi:hypothetical protein
LFKLISFELWAYKDALVLFWVGPTPFQDVCSKEPTPALSWCGEERTGSLYYNITNKRFYQMLENLHSYLQPCYAMPKARIQSLHQFHHLLDTIKQGKKTSYKIST